MNELKNLEASGGWISIHRCITEHWLWAHPRKLQWWLDLLFMASWKDRDVLVGNKVFTLKRGQLIASNSMLRQRWRYKGEDRKMHTPSPLTIQQYLLLLECDNMVTIDTTKLPNSITLITIVNYDNYQRVKVEERRGGDNTYDNTCDNTCDNTYDNTYDNDKNNLNNIIINTTNARVRAREGNKGFLEEYFDPKRRASLEQVLMGLHRNNPEIETIEDFRAIAEDCVAEWEQNGEAPARDYTEFSKHLISHVRVKLRMINREKMNKQYGNNRTNSQENARAERMQQYADYVKNLLAKPTDTGNN